MMHLNICLLIFSFVMYHLILSDKMIYLEFHLCSHDSFQQGYPKVLK